jgi:serine/threonine protein kinase
MTTRPVSPSLPGYDIQGVIGRGGMGVVYRAIQVDLERPVAVKTISRELMADERIRARFVRESRTAASLEHPHIVPILAAGESEGQLFIVMRLIEGQSLADLLRREGPLPFDVATDVVIQAAGALSAAHRAGIVHRDVKPGNILLAGEAPYHVFLTDFGLAVSETASKSLTATGEWIGTLEYSSPEQLRGDAVDARADVFGLGCVLYACLTGHPPRAAETAPEIPPAMSAVLRRALAKRREDRFASVDALAAAIAAAAEDRPVAPTLIAPTRATPGSDPVRARRPRWLVPAIALAILAVAGLVLALIDVGHDSDGSNGNRPAITAARPAGDTVRCADGRCLQGGQRVITPVEGAQCERAGHKASWARIDDDAPEPMLICRPSEGPPSGVSLLRTLPDLTDARLDHARKTLGRFGVANTVSSDALLGIFDEGNWQVCATTPAPGARLAASDKVTLFVKHAC